MKKSISAIFILLVLICTQQISSAQTPALLPGISTPTNQLTNNYTGGPQTITCSPSSLATCPGGECLSYQWQQSTNGSTWTDISGFTSLSYNPGAYQPVTKTYYRLKTTAAGYSPVYTATDTIDVQNSPINGAVDVWNGQSATYYYSSFGNTSTFLWSAPVGVSTVIGSASGVGSVTVKWSGSSGLYTLNLLNNSNPASPTVIATLKIYLHSLPLNTGQIGKRSQILEQFSPITISTYPNTAIGGSCNGNFTYQWQQSTDAVNFSNIPGQTNTDLIITPVQNTYYRRLVTCGTTVSTDTTLVTLIPFFNPGNAIAGNTDSIPWNTIPVVISGTNPTGGQDSIYRYQWQYTTDGINYSDVLTQGNSANYQPTIPLTVNTRYRRRVTNALLTRCTNDVTILVKKILFDPGTINPYTSVINSGNAQSFSGTAATGGTIASYTYQWQQSYDELNWTNSINGNTQNYVSPSLTRTTYYRRLVTNGAQSGYSSVSGFLNTVKVKVKTTQPITAGNNIATTVNTPTYPNITNGKINYERTWSVNRPGITALSAAKALSTTTDYQQSTTYYDDLGREIETVAKQATLNNNDLISVVNYDLLGRVVQKFLPYSDGASSGNFRTDAAAQQTAFYNTQYNNLENFYYSNTLYDGSPLNRVWRETAPGKNWTGLSIGSRMDYTFNNSLDSVKIWGIGSGISDIPKMMGNYGPGTLALVITTDEHENKTMEYKDKEGKLILKKVQISDTLFNGYYGWLSTYYVYDTLNNLRTVIQPQGVKYLSTALNWDLSYGGNILLNEQCFLYYYDNRRKMIAKKVPGADWVYMLYDGLERLVMTQDGNQRAGGRWMVSKYDVLHRPVSTFIITDTDVSHDAIYHFNNAFVSYNNTQGISSYPDVAQYSNSEQLSETVYDNYGSNISYAGFNITESGVGGNTLNPDNNNYPYAQPFPQGSYVNPIRGMVAYTRTKVLGSSATFVISLPTYDGKGRVIQTKILNHTGGIDYNTTQYSWNGTPLVSIQKQQFGSSGQWHSVITKMEYDNLWRLVIVKKSVSSLVNNISISKPEQVIVNNEYDILGRLKKKSLAPSFGGGAGLETLNYDYNIRGWLSGLNKSFVNDGSNNNYFGFELGYDKPSTIVSGTNYLQQQYNGNISGTVWKSKGDAEKRKYDFSYDAANRLMRADFTQYSSNNAFDQSAGANFNVKMGDGISAGTAYDANGNILQMQQWGLKIAGSSQIDNLRYTYIPGSNKLKSVTDFNNDTQTILGDFKMSATHPQTATKSSLTATSAQSQFDAITDYSYDVNGNLMLDNNKSITSIVYNHLNLPQIITTTKGTISYTYDASGNKLRKQTNESNATVAFNGVNYTNVAITTTTNYLNGFIYESKSYSNTALNSLGYADKLQFTGHEEGRIRALYANTQKPTTPTGYVYDYMLKDHLGNVRMVLTEEQQQDVYPAATLETNAVVEEKKWYNIDTSYVIPRIPYLPGLTDAKNYQNNNGNPPYNNNPTSTTSALSEKLYYIHGQQNKMGLGITLKVMAGDKLNIFGRSYYFNNGSVPPGISSIPVTSLLDAFLNSPVTAGKGLTGALLSSSVTGLSDAVTGFLNNNRETGTLKPRAYINWVFFDEQFKFAGGSFSQVGGNDEVTFHDLSKIPLIDVPKNGYVFVYCSNESNLYVLFDNLQVIHTRGPILEETHYYPFGLTIAGISSKAMEFGGQENWRKFNNGTEINTDFDISLYETNFRSYDPQLGRFWQIDPLADITPYNSPYLFANNNPILFNDPLGLMSDSLHPQELPEVVITVKKRETYLASYISAPRIEYGDSWIGNGFKFVGNVGVSLYNGLVGTVDMVTHPINTLEDLTEAGDDIVGYITDLENSGDPLTIIGDDLANLASNPETWENVAAILVAAKVGKITNGVKNISELKLKPLRAPGGKINGITISKGKGYGAKPRFDIHPLGNASKKSNSLPSWTRNKTVPHYHRGKGGNLHRHRPWEKGWNDKSFWNRF